jgi:glycosyltransferase involved in cell wall biosynthesis
MIKNKVVCVSYHNPPKTGAHFRFDRLVTHLAKKGKSILWISPPRTDFANYKNIEFLQVNKKASESLAWIRIFLSVFKYSLYLSKYRQSVQYVITFGETNLLAAFWASFVLHAPLSIGVRSNIIKRRNIILILNNEKSIKKSFKRAKLILQVKVWHLIYYFANQIIVQSPQAKFEFLNNFKVNENKIFIIENDLPPKFKERSLYSDVSNKLISDQPRKFLFVGNSSRIKGVDILIEAIPKIETNLPFIEQFTIVGVQYEEVQLLINKVEKCQIKIEFISWCSDICTLMKEHDLLIVPSREDQFPNVILEALAMGIPVIGSAVDGIKHILSNDLVLFPPEDSVALANCICHIAQPEEYAKAKKIAKERASYFDFNWEEYYMKILEKIS